MSTEREPILSPKTKTTLGVIAGIVSTVFAIAWWASGISHKLDSILVFQQGLAAKDAELAIRVENIRTDLQAKIDKVSDRQNETEKRVTFLERKP